MALSVHIQDMGSTAAIVDLVRFGDNLVDMKPAMRKAGTILRYSVKQQFETEGFHGGTPWPELADSTIFHKADHGLDLRTLRATGDLYRSLAVKSDSEHIEEVEDDSLLFGSHVHYAIYHQSREPRYRLPYRPPVALSKLDQRLIVKAIQERALQQVRGGRR